MLNTVNIYEEYLSLLLRNNYNNTDVAVVCGISKQAVRMWKSEKQIREYLELIANQLGDARFLIAVHCYRNDISNFSMKRMADRYRDDLLSLSIGTKKEDSESDVSIDELIEILSMQNSNTDINHVAKIINEVIETGTYMTIFPKLIAREYRLNMNQLALEVR